MERSDGSRPPDLGLNRLISCTRTSLIRCILLVVDGQEVSTYGADGMICQLPTTYSFSAGGPSCGPLQRAIVSSPAGRCMADHPPAGGALSLHEIVLLDDMWTSQ